MDASCWHLADGGNDGGGGDDDVHQKANGYTQSITSLF